MTFTWDEEKNATNIHKHHLSFTTAIRAFADPNSMGFYDGKHSINEDRYIIIGRVTDTFIAVVVYTVLEENVYRIISARKATKLEEALYYKTGF